MNSRLCNMLSKSPTTKLHPSPTGHFTEKEGGGGKKYKSDSR
jgi:hypothetical protein